MFWNCTIKTNHIKIVNIIRVIYFLFIFVGVLYSEKRYVLRVVDGDTIILENNERVRLIGVDTPELHESNKLFKDSKRNHQDIKTIKKLGKKSYLFTKSLIEHKDVEIELDPINQRINHKDKYGRTLAYVYFQCNSPPEEYLVYLSKVAKINNYKPQKLMFNRLLLQCGYSNVYLQFPYKYLDEFRQLAIEARELKIGLWSDSEFN